ncbi:Hint domain-containing protein [Halothiobacillus diazotrophicus]|uniref:Hint domain-containing protein n=1 Tax=Halothiobacillus diazotrophicus TaxID=1860122 RepID=UPI0018D41B66|nr:Hint domain-containing protein [Halothiobacillus diazotrophicus]
MSFTLDSIKLPPKGASCFVAGTLVHTREGLVPIERIKVGDWVLSKPQSGEGEPNYKQVKKTFRSENQEVMFVEIIPIAELERAKKIQKEIQGKEGLSTLIRNEMKQYLVATPNHPFWVNEVGWLEASEIDPSDNLEVQLVTGEPAYMGEGHRGSLYQTQITEGVVWFEFYDMHGYGMIPVDLRHGEPQADINWSALQPQPDSEMGQGYPETELRQTVYNLEVVDYDTYYVGRMGVWVRNCDLSEYKGQ